MERYLFDVEADDLLPGVTICWMVHLIDLDTEEEYHYPLDDLGWQARLGRADLVVGHNILSYDIPLLFKLFKFRLKKACKVHDTLLMSQILDYRRFGHDGHSLGRWGEHFGYPKLDFHDFELYAEDVRAFKGPDKLLRPIEEWYELLNFPRTGKKNGEEDPVTYHNFRHYMEVQGKYCQRDCKLNVKTYNALMEELQKKNPATKGKLATYLKAEHAAALWVSKANLHGWPFDVEAAKALFEELTDLLAATTERLESRLGKKCVPVDKNKGIVYEKKPKWVLSGNYHAHTSSWFEIDPETGQDPDRLVEGPYCRVTFPDLKLSSVADVKIFLFRNGWVPTEYNYKQNPITLKMEPTSPKITEDSLEFLGGDGKLYVEYLTANSRHGILKTWLENVDEKGRLHGDCMLIGTPSMRARHQIIVNVPSTDSAYGEQMRKLFKAKPGWKLLGCDSSGNQARGLAHYIGNADFTKRLIEGNSDDGTDIHTFNAQVLTKIVQDMGTDRVVERGEAKRILYAFLFGASGGKLWSYIFGRQDSRKGNQLKNGFTRAVPGFKALLEKLERVYSKTGMSGDGYIPSIAGNRVYVDSYHKLLVYLLQACEKATCSAACMLLMEWLEEESIPYIPCIYYHDELDFMVPEEHAERAKELGSKAFREGPKLFGIDIMDGEGKIGDNWYDVH